MSEGPHRAPPTLPRPSAWRLAVAAVVIVAFLYLMYRTGERAETPPPLGRTSGLVVPAAPA